MPFCLIGEYSISVRVTRAKSIESNVHGGISTNFPMPWPSYSHDISLVHKLSNGKKEKHLHKQRKKVVVRHVIS